MGVAHAMGETEVTERCLRHWVYSHATGFILGRVFPISVSCNEVMHKQTMKFELCLDCSLGTHADTIAKLRVLCTDRYTELQGRADM